MKVTKKLRLSRRETRFSANLGLGVRFNRVEFRGSRGELDLELSMNEGYHQGEVVYPADKDITMTLEWDE